MTGLHPRRALFIVIAGILIAISFGYHLLYKEIYDTIIEHEAGQLSDYIFSVCNYLKKQNISYELDKIDKLLDSLAPPESNIRITIMDTSGKVLGDSWNNPKKMDIHSDREEFREAISRGKGFSIRYSRTMGKYMLYVAMPLRINNKMSGVIRAARPLKQIQAFALKAKRYLIYFSVLLAGCFVFGVLWQDWISTRYLKHILSTILALFKQDEATFFLSEPKTKEKGMLTDIYSIKNKIQELSLKVEALNNINRAFRNTRYTAILITDHSGIIHEYNDGAVALSENRNLKGLNIKDIIRNREFVRKLKETQESNFESEMKLDFLQAEKVLTLKARMISLPRNIIIEFLDESRIKMLESLKRELTTNIGHELRTPLTIIKGYVETLQEGALENKAQNQRFLSTINSQILKMEEILNEISLLANLEKKEELKKEEVNVLELIKDVMDGFEIISKKSGIALKLEAKREVYAHINPALFRQAIINLLDNAIKFSPPETLVLVDVTEEKGQLRIRIKDQGYGIPLQYQDRIFERFYSLNHKREKTKAGIGLGLSIVKKILKLHGGDVTVKSEPGKGSIFVLIIPAHKR